MSSKQRKDVLYLVEKYRRKYPEIERSRLTPIISTKEQISPDTSEYRRLTRAMAKSFKKNPFCKPAKRKSYADRMLEDYVKWRDNEIDQMLKEEKV